MTKSFLRTSSLVTLSVLCFATTCFAQAEPPTIRGFAKSLARMNLMLNHCEFDQPELAPSNTRPIMVQTLGLFADALIERASLLGVEREDARRGVAEYMAAFERQPPNLNALLASCNPEAAANLTKSLTGVQTSGYQDMLSAYAKGSHYDRPFNAVGTQLKTYATPATQRRIVSGMVTHFDACDHVKVDDIKVVGKTNGSSNRLPVFVKPALIYEEEWALTCDSKAKIFAVKHARDSEGPVGHYIVTPIQSGEGSD